MNFSLQDGNTPLILASGLGHLECVKVLLDRGAHVNLQTKVSAFLDEII
jgi:ankyrin repeat protein